MEPIKLNNKYLYCMNYEGNNSYFGMKKQYSISLKNQY